MTGLLGKRAVSASCRSALCAVAALAVGGGAVAAADAANFLPASDTWLTVVEDRDELTFLAADGRPLAGEAVRVFRPHTGAADIARAIAASSPTPGDGAAVTGADGTVRREYAMGAGGESLSGNVFQPTHSEWVVVRGDGRPESGKVEFTVLSIESGRVFNRTAALRVRCSEDGGSCDRAPAGDFSVSDYSLVPSAACLKPLRPVGELDDGSCRPEGYGMRLVASYRFP